jgi:hypothetical protein
MSIKPEVIEDSEVSSAIQKVGKSFNAFAMKELMEKFEAKVSDMIEAAKDIRVRSDNTEAQAVEMATAAKKLSRFIDKARSQAKRPYLDFNQQLDGMVMPIIKSLKKLEADQRKKCTAYRNELLRAEREKQAETAKLGNLTLSTKKAPKPAEGKVETVMGSAGYQKVKVAKLVDISKVPEKYLIVDMKKVQADVQSGIMQIPGIEIVEEVKMSVRS